MTTTPTVKIDTVVSDLIAELTARIDETDYEHSPAERQMRLSQMATLPAVGRLMSAAAAERADRAYLLSQSAQMEAEIPAFGGLMASLREQPI